MDSIQSLPPPASWSCFSAAPNSHVEQYTTFRPKFVEWDESAHFFEYLMKTATPAKLTKLVTDCGTRCYKNSPFRFISLRYHWFRPRQDVSFWTVKPPSRHHIRLVACLYNKPTRASRSLLRRFDWLKARKTNTRTTRSTHRQAHCGSGTPALEVTLPNGETGTSRNKLRSQSEVTNLIATSYHLPPRSMYLSVNMLMMCFCPFSMLVYFPQYTFCAKAEPSR